MNGLDLHPVATSPLARSELTVTITDLAAEYELKHVFRNTGSAAMEAVYSFPVPLDAAFMGMEATLAGEHLVATVQPRADAARDYDDAIAEGNSAVLLERIEPGMLCVSLGNLKPGEEGEITLRFAAPLHCMDGTARFSLPLVHRPRYGRSRLDELIEPRHDFAVEHPLEAVIRVRGLLASAPVSCATHAARFTRDDAGQELRLNAAMLDRDLVLVFALPADFTGAARLVRDGDGAIGILAFNLPAALGEPAPCDVCLVMDGSGSMEGDAIYQSRAALAAVAGNLGGRDRIQVLRFGSTTVPMFRRPLRASPRVQAALTELAGTLAADLGGTEIGAALLRAVADLAGIGDAPDESRSRAIILVTDGAVQPAELEDAQARATQAGVRIFVVAVGSSAGADVLAPLAAATRGVLERAVPAEPIDEVVLRQLRRAHRRGPVLIEVDWSAPDALPLPIDAVYPGDACTAIAIVPMRDGVEAGVRIGGTEVARRFRFGSPEDAPALRALAGQALYAHAAPAGRQALALRYGLVTDETSAVLVKVRADGERVEGLPTVVPVPHMLPEGMVAAAAMCIPPPVAFTSESYGDAPAFLRRSPSLDADTTDVAAAELRFSLREPPERPEPDPALLDAIARALVRVLLDETPDEVTTDRVLAALDPEWLDAARTYLMEQYPEGMTRRRARALLKRLQMCTWDMRLTDDEEAGLACLLAE